MIQTNSCSLCNLMTISVLTTGVLGAYAYMGPKAGRDVFVLKPETADLTFGVITVLTGILGTVCS